MSKKIHNYKTIYLKYFLKILLIILTLIVIGAITLGASLVIIFSYYAQDLPDIEKNELTEQSTKILDRDGNLLYEVHGEINRTKVPLKNISPWVEKATLALEDRYFYKHPGFDWKGLTRVILTHGYNFSRKIFPFLPWKQTVGGSTITQQLVKNTILSNDRTIKRKVQELLLARNIEQKYSKREILELYLNNIPYGGSTYGIEAAAEKYFGISSSSLTPAQAATLAALPQSPTYLSPYGNNIDKLLNRKNKALRTMFSLDLIKKDEYKVATEEELEFQPFIEKIKHPHFVLYAKEKLTQVLMEKYDKEKAEFMVENGGLIVKTTLDPDVQEIAELTISEGIAEVSKHGASNLALVAQNPRNGQILAMVGSVNFFDSENDGQVNVALAQRQPGSSIKPLIYTQAFLEGYSPATIVYDTETDFGSNYKPNNYDLEFPGPISFRSSLAQSRNVPAVKALFLAGIQDSIDLARRMGITTWGEGAADRCGLSLVLGGCEVRLIDMVQAYSVLNNLGKKHKQSVLLEIKKNDGEILYSWEKPEEEEVLDAATAYQIVNIMSDRESRLPTFGSSLDISRKAAVKTGTTNAYLDAWTIGFVPQITAGVWGGNNKPSSMKHGGSFVAGPIWKKFMNEVFKLEEYLKAENWKEPAKIEHIKISNISGKLPSGFTPEDKIKEEIFSPYNIPTEIEPDTLFETAEICDASGLLATEYCPEYLRTTLVYTYHHSIRPDLPNWEDPVQEWAKEKAEELNKNPKEIIEEEQILDGKKIKYITDISEIPLEYDTTFNRNSLREIPKLHWEDEIPVSNLIFGNNLIKIDINAKNDLDKLDVFLDNESVFKRKFIKKTDNINISIFIDSEKYTLDSKHDLKIIVIDNKKLRGNLQNKITIKEDIIPPEIITFNPADKKTFSRTTDEYVTINAQISDNKDELERIELFLNGIPLKTFLNKDGLIEYQINIEEELSDEDEHVITLRAFDESENMTKEFHKIKIK